MECKNETFENMIFDCLENDYIQCVFKNVDFSKCDLSNKYFEQCTFFHCDFSNSIYSKFISKGNEYISSKFVGTNMMESRLENVSFKECVLRYSNFSESNFIRIKKLNKVNFDHCKLIRTDFFETKLDKMDFRTCDISEIKVKLEDLRGLIVTSYQAVSLSTILGLKIID